MRSIVREPLALPPSYRRWIYNMSDLTADHILDLCEPDRYRPCDVIGHVGMIIASKWLFMNG